MDRIEGDVERQLRRFGGSGSMPRIVAVWPAAVGAEVARNAWPARVGRDGTLHVHTSSAVWAFELGQLAGRILGQLAAELGPESPTTLRFAPGHLPELADAPPATTPPGPRPPSPRARAEAARLTAGIEDAELRKQVERAISLGLSIRSDGRSL
jgi:Dna[CI] antecedent, DciA